MTAARTVVLRVAVLAIAVGLLAGCGSPTASSGPPASPTISCAGIPSAKCEEAVASVARSLPNSHPVSIEVMCVSGTCTPESGAMDTVVTLPDGSTLRSSTLSWSEPGAGSGVGTGDGVVPPGEPAPAEPAIPIEPACQGVPAQMCRTMAETAFGELSTEAVISILVRCGRPPCTAEGGAGDTIVTYADGTTDTASWEYAGGG